MIELLLCFLVGVLVCCSACYVALDVSTLRGWPRARPLPRVSIVSEPLPRASIVSEALLARRLRIARTELRRSLRRSS